MKKKLFFVFLLFLGLGGLIFSYSKRSSCFSPDFISSDATFNLGSKPPMQELETILDQAYTFLGSGNQAFAFESQDGKFVLKLFKFHSLQGFDLYDFIPRLDFLKTFHENHVNNRKKKINRLLNGLLLAENYNRENSGIIYIHFPPTSLFGKKISLRDRAGRIHSLDLKDFVFVLQHKAVSLGEVLNQHLYKNDVQSAANKLFLIYKMIANDLKEGLYDNDHNVIANTGFVQEKPIRIDFGKLSLKPEMKNLYREEIKKINEERILPWLIRFHPHYKNELEKTLDLIQKNI